MMKKRLFSLLLCITMLSGLFMPVKAAELPTLTLISGKAGANGEYGSQSVYPTYLGANIDPINESATYSWSPSPSGSNSMNDGKVLYCPPGWGYDVALNDESTPYKITFDLKDEFEVTRVDVHELYVSASNYLSGVSVKVGTTPENLTAVETSEMKQIQPTAGSNNIKNGRANILELTTPATGRYVEITITVGNDAIMGEVMVFGNKIQLDESTLLSGNALTDADKEWYKTNQKLTINPYETSVNYRWFDFELDSNVTVPTRIRDDDTNGDGIGGDKNIADGNVTSRDNEYIVPVSGAGANMVVYDLGKRCQIDRVDVHEFVNSSNGIGNITVFVGDEYNSLVNKKSVYMTYSTEAELVHKLNTILLDSETKGRYVGVRFGMDDGDSNTQNLSSYILGEVLVFGSDADESTKTPLLTLSGQTWNAGAKSFYQANGFELESLPTGATWKWEPVDESKGTTRTFDTTVTVNGSLDDNATWFNQNETAALTFDLKGVRNVNRIDFTLRYNTWNSIDTLELFASDSENDLYTDAKKFSTTSRPANADAMYYFEGSGNKYIMPVTFEGVDARYIGIRMTCKSHNTHICEVGIFGSDNKFANLNSAISEAKRYNNYIAYEDEDNIRLEDAVAAAQSLLDTDASQEAINAACDGIYDAISRMSIRGGEKLLSHNNMYQYEWDRYSDFYPEIYQEEFPQKAVRLMTADDGVANVDSSLTNNSDKTIGELFDGYSQGIDGNSAVWGDWTYDERTVYVLYDFGETVWVNGADVISYDYRSIDGTKKYLKGISVEVSNDGVNFTPAGSNSAEPIESPDKLGKNLNTFTSCSFPAVKARYVKVAITKPAEAIQMVLKEMFIRGGRDFANEIILSKEGGNINADLVLDNIEDSATLFLAVYDEEGNLDRVELSKKLTDESVELSLTVPINPGQIAKAMCFDSIETIKPLTEAAIKNNFKECDFTLSGMFTDGGVLQRGKATPIYGTATTGTNVSVSVNGESFQAVADENGEWKVEIPVTVGNVYDIAATDGKKEFMARGMLAGDVWLCSGQSNMYYSFNLLKYYDEMPTPEEIAKYTNLKYYAVPVVGADEPQNTVSGEWIDIAGLSQEELKDISAIPLFSGMELCDYTDVPIGIIRAARGGTSIEGFISREGLLNSDAARFWNALDKSAYYNGMIEPVVPYGICGVLWYQGCQNHGNAINGAYIDLQKALINEYRAKWNNDKLPFFITMLSTEPGGGGFPTIRDQQLAMRDIMDNVGVVSIMDLGYYGSSTNMDDTIHPDEKKEVARRLILAAKAIAYNDSTVNYRFPVMKSVSLKADGSVDVVFDDVYEGLKIKSGDSKITGFKLMVNGSLYDANAEITSKDTVNVKVDGVIKPTAVWYGYAGRPAEKLNLFNSEDLSAAPFFISIN